jgi:hypothetical protein
MRRSFKCICLLAFVMAASPAAPLKAAPPPLSAHGQPAGQPDAALARQSRQQSERETITVPFSPLLDTPLHFRIIKTEVGAHKPPDRVYDQELTYHATAGGYLLTVKTFSIWVNGQVFYPLDASSGFLPIADVISLASPITLRLGPTGRVIEVNDWDDLRNFIRHLPDRLAGTALVGARGRVRENATTAIQPIVQVDSVGAWNFLAAEWPPMLGFGGAQLPLDETLTTSNVHNLFDGAVPVKLNHQVRVTRRADGGLALDETQRPNHADFASAVSQFYDQLATSTSPKALAARRAIDADLRQDLVRTATTHVELDANGAFQSGYWIVTNQRADGTMETGERVSFENLGTSPPARGSN